MGSGRNGVVRAQLLHEAPQRVCGVYAGPKGYPDYTRGSRGSKDGLKPPKPPLDVDCEVF